MTFCHYLWVHHRVTLWGREVAGSGIGVVESVGSIFMLFISSFLNI
jgi:hypothetical protein